MDPLVSGGSMTINSRVMLWLQVHTRVTSKIPRNVRLVIPSASSQAIYLLLQLACDLGLNVLLQLLSSIGFRLLPCLVLLLQVAFQHHYPCKCSLELVS